MKKKLLITVGAGGSLDFGLQSVGEVDMLLDSCAATMYPLSLNTHSNLYRHCRDMIATYYDGASTQGTRRWVNFEEVIYQLNGLAPYFSDPLRHHGSNALLMRKPLPDVNELGSLSKPVNGDVLRGLTNILLDHLIDHFIDACASAAINKASEIRLLGEFLTTLRDEFDVGILSLNYDDIFTQACPGLHTGFNAVTGQFEPLSVLARSDWDFIYNLHGSIHFRMSHGPYDLHRIDWTPMPTKDHSVHALGRNTQSSTEGTSYPTSTIVAGYGKTQQILRQPFRTYFAQINRLVHEADSLLFIGYGFGDLHLNAAFSEIRDRRRPTLVLDWADPGQDPLPFRRDTWTYNLFNTLPSDSSRMSSPGHSAPADVGDLKAANEVECSNDPNHPLAVWYNGLLAACRHAGALLPYLR